MLYPLVREWIDAYDRAFLSVPSGENTWRQELHDAAVQFRAYLGTLELESTLTPQLVSESLREFSAKGVREATALRMLTRLSKFLDKRLDRSGLPHMKFRILAVRSRQKGRGRSLDEIPTSPDAIGFERPHAYSLPAPKSPKEIFDELQSRVVGQKHAKVLLSVLFSLHLVRINSQSASRPTHAIVVGPTGVGKTHSLRVASASLGLPFVAVDCTSLVPAGIRGYKIEYAFAELLNEACTLYRLTPGPKAVEVPGVKFLAERGVIFLDEFDKLAISSKEKDAEYSGAKLVQRHLLKVLDGNRSEAGDGEQGYRTSFDTSNVLFVAGGAFVDIRNPTITKHRSATISASMATVKTNRTFSEDIKNYGLLDELVARLPIIIDYDELDRDSLRQILFHPHESPLVAWNNYLAYWNASAKLEESATQFVCQYAKDSRLGARGLGQILFPAMAHLGFEVADHSTKGGHVSRIIGREDLLRGLTRGTGGT